MLNPTMMLYNIYNIYNKHYTNRYMIIYRNVGRIFGALITPNRGRLQKVYRFTALPLHRVKVLSLHRGRAWKFNLLAFGGFNLLGFGAVLEWQKVKIYRVYMLYIIYMLYNI